MARTDPDGSYLSFGPTAGLLKPNYSGQRSSKRHFLTDCDFTFICYLLLNASKTRPTYPYA